MYISIPPSTPSIERERFDRATSSNNGHTWPEVGARGHAAVGELVIVEHFVYEGVQRRVGDNGSDQFALQAGVVDV